LIRLFGAESEEKATAEGYTPVCTKRRLKKARRFNEIELGEFAVFIKGIK
jgi:hypothetical protein